MARGSPPPLTQGKVLTEPERPERSDAGSLRGTPLNRWFGSGSCRSLVYARGRGHKRRLPGVFRRPAIQRTAAAYSPTWWGSTIGDGGLNFSVRNGKRWYPAAIATAIYYLREINTKPFRLRSILQFHPGLFFLLRKDFGLLVQVD